MKVVRLDGLVQASVLHIPVSRGSGLVTPNAQDQRRVELAVQKTVTLGSRLLHLDVGNAPNIAQSLKSSPLLMLLCQGWKE